MLTERSAVTKKLARSTEGKAAMIANWTVTEQGEARVTRLEDQCGTLGLAVTTKLEVLASLEGHVTSVLADGAFQPQHNLLRGLGLLVEDGLGLTTVAALLPVVTPLSLSHLGSLASLVLGDLVRGVLLALLTLAVGAASLGHVDHLGRILLEELEEGSVGLGAFLNLKHCIKAQDYNTVRDCYISLNPSPTLKN